MSALGDIFAQQMMHAAASRMPRIRSESFAEFAAKNLYIRTEDLTVVPFALRDIQIRYLQIKLDAIRAGRPKRFLLLKYRQGGFTTLEQAQSYEMVTRNRNVNVMTLSYDAESSSKIFRIPLLFHDRDPEAPPIKGQGNRERLEFPSLNSIFTVGTAAGRSSGRGETLSRAHWSEVAWSCPGYDQIEKQREVLSGLLGATKKGELVLETTPRGQELFYELYTDAKKGKNDYTPIFLPWFADMGNSDPISDPEETVNILRGLDDDEARLRAKHGLTAEQIKWRRRLKREYKHLFAQEFPEDDETCWLVGGNCFFLTQMLLELRDKITAPELIDGVPGTAPHPRGAKLIPGGYEMMWEPPVRGEDYCLGADCSEGLPTSDPNGIGLMHRNSGRQVYSLHGLFTARALADHIVRVHRLYNDALVGIERENHGHAVIQKVIDLGVHRSHFDGGSLYYHGTAPKELKKDERVARAGWSTNVITRPVMLSQLNDWLEAPGIYERLRDREMLSECFTFRKQSDGQYSADSGHHDDSVMKWAICNHMRTIQWRRQRCKVLDVNRWQRR